MQNAANLGPLAFLYSKDSVSGFARICGILLCLLSVIATFALLVTAAVELATALLSSVFPVWPLAFFVLGLLLVYFQVHHFDFFHYLCDYVWEERKIPIGCAVVISVFFAALCSLYILFLNWMVPTLFATSVALYCALAQAEIVVTRRAQPFPVLGRKLLAAALRALRETALLISIGFAFTLMTQIYVVMWTSFSTQALWL